jgi:fluoride exporter
MNLIKILIIIGSGSFLGGISRFLVSRWVQDSVSSSFPWATMIVNLAGCFLIGVLYGISDKGNLIGLEWRLFLTVGFCASFTTFSTFSHESLALLKDGNILLFALYAGVSVFIGILATFFGNGIIKWI